MADLRDSVIRLQLSEFISFYLNLNFEVPVGFTCKSVRIALINIRKEKVKDSGGCSEMSPSCKASSPEMNSEKQIGSMLTGVCSVIDHKRRQNTVRTSVAYSVIASCATSKWNLFVL